MGMRAYDRSSQMQIDRRPVSLITLAVGIVLGFLLLSAFAHVARTGLWNRVAGYMTGRSTSIDVSSPAVVERIQMCIRDSSRAHHSRTGPYPVGFHRNLRMDAERRRHGLPTVAGRYRSGLAKPV